MKPQPRTWLAFLAAFWPFALGSLLVAGGIAAIVLGYFGVAGTLHVGLQTPYLVSGGILGLALVVLGSALLLLHAMGRQARLLRRLLERAAHPADDGKAREGADGDVVVAARGGRWYHRPGCLLVQGKDAERLAPGTAAGRGLSPCRLCDPVTAAV